MQSKASERFRSDGNGVLAKKLGGEKASGSTGLYNIMAIIFVTQFFQLRHRGNFYLTVCVCVCMV